MERKQGGMIKHWQVYQSGSLKNVHLILNVLLGKKVRVGTLITLFVGRAKIHLIF